MTKNIHFPLRVEECFSSYAVTDADGTMLAIRPTRYYAELLVSQINELHVVATEKGNA